MATATSSTGRVTYAQNTYEAAAGQADPTLDRSYDYDNVGRLFNSYTGTEARAHTGRPGGAWGVHDGPYSQAYLKDVWGNVTQKLGRAGDPDQFAAGYTNNRRDGFSYDAAGNLTFDGGQHFTYDATGQQTYVDWTDLRQWYDGDRLRVKKTEGGQATYYLRSSVLGGKVVAEINASGSLQRGYVYGAGGGLLAIQYASAVTWVYQDAATKSQRLVDGAGNVTAGVDLDPWGRETARSWNSQAQPHRYSTYERDGNDSDEAMMRRYNRWHLRFDQPDPYDGSYDLSDPQSFNRYAYTDNDPVNFTDPPGLMWNAWDSWETVSPGFWGGGWNFNDRPGAGREIVADRFNSDVRQTYVQWSYETVDEDGITMIVFFTDLIYYSLGRIGRYQIDYTDVTRAIRDSARESRKRDVARLMEEGQKRDRWQQWLNCAESYRASHQQALNNKLDGYTIEENYAATTGVVGLMLWPEPKSAYTFGVALGGAGVRRYSAWRQERNAFINEAETHCGPMPPAPAGVTAR